MASLPGEEMYLYNGEAIFATPDEAKAAYDSAEKSSLYGWPLTTYVNNNLSRSHKLASGYWAKVIRPGRNVEYAAARKETDNWDRLTREQRRLHSALDGSFWKR